MEVDIEKDVEKFLQAEETAVRLVETLKQLHTEATSYQSATKHLNSIGQRLLKLIETAERLVGDIHELIKIFKEIGGLKILNRLAKLKNTSHSNTCEFNNSNYYWNNWTFEIKNETATTTILYMRLFKKVGNLFC